MSASVSHKRNVFYNIIGQVLPIVAGLVSVPFIVKGLGTERFGVISITWMVIGYFSLFDMGLGRALTQAVAERIGKGKYGEIPTCFWTSLAFMTAMALIGALVVMLSAGLLVGKILKISSSLQTECLHSFYVLALSIPSVIISSALSGFLSAYHRFDILNAIRVPMSTAIIMAPLAVLPFTHSLVVIIGLMTCIRFVFCAVYFKYCLDVEPMLGKKIDLSGSTLRSLLTFGGWLTVSNIVGPIMVNFDRLVIGSFLSVTSVAYYATPYEIITKLWIVPAAVNGVTFPLYASMYKSDRDEVVRIFIRSLMAIYFMLYPIILLVVTFALDGMAFWIGGEFAMQSYRVLQWLAIGVFLNCLAQVPYTLIQGSNSPDITCKLHVIELVMYVPLLFALLQRYGIEGAAIAWSLRTIIDTVLLFWIAIKRSGLTNLGMTKSFSLMGMSLIPLVHLVVFGCENVQYGFFVLTLILFALSVLYVKPHRYLQARL